MEDNIRIHWKYITIYLLVFFDSFASCLHLGTVSQKKISIQQKKQLNESKAHKHGVDRKQFGDPFIPQNATDVSQPSIKKLQVEIQELLRMQKQLQSEMVSGADNAKKTELLQHIKTQIQLRRMQQKSSKQKHDLKGGEKSNTDFNNKHADKLPKHKPETFKQQRSKANFDSKHADKLHKHKPKASKQQSDTVKTNQQIHLLEQSMISHGNTALSQNLQKSQYQQQNEQIQQLRKQKQELKERSQYSVQQKTKQMMPIQNGIQQNEQPVLGTGQNLQMPYANLDVSYNTLQLQNQPQLQMQPMSPTAFIQQRVPVQINNANGINQAPINMMQQQGTIMSQVGGQIEPSQHVLVPVNALPINNFVPGNLLSGERFIVLDTALQDNVQLRLADGSLLIQPDKQKSTEKPTTIAPSTTKPTTQVQQITKPTTQRPSTTVLPTVATKPPPTDAPKPVVVESTANDPIRVNSGMFKQQFYSGELQRQQLEITKLKLEIRALRRKEMAEMQMQMGGGGENENEDAPPRRSRMMRFRQNKMPFRFF